jgi:hypothetical protein
MSYLFWGNIKEKDHLKDLDIDKKDNIKMHLIEDVWTLHFATWLILLNKVMKFWDT